MVDLQPGYDWRVEEATARTAMHSTASTIQRLYEFLIYTNLGIPYQIHKARFNLERQIGNLDDLEKVTDRSSPFAKARIDTIGYVREGAVNLHKRLRYGIPEDYPDVVWDTAVGTDMVAYTPFIRKGLMEGRKEGFLSPGNMKSMLRTLASTTFQRYSDGKRYLLNEEDHNPEKNAELVCALLFVIENGFGDAARPAGGGAPADKGKISYISGGGTRIEEIDVHYAGYGKGFKEYVEGRKWPIKDVIKRRGIIKGLAKNMPEDADEDELWALNSNCFSGNLVKSASHLLLERLSEKN